MLQLDPAGSNSLMLWAHTNVAANGQPFGWAIESNVFFPLQPANGEVAGQGFDYTNFNRGGLESVYNNGGDFVLYNDGRGFPYNAAATYAINAPVYASAITDGLVDSATTSGVIVGYVVSFDVATAPTQLEIKSII